MVAGMLKPLVATLLAIACALPASGGDSRRLMLTEQSQKAWDAVGRLNIRGQGHCTATLIAPDLVLTAAHCVANRRTGKIVHPDQVHFLAGFRKGSYSIHGRVATIRPAKGYFGGGRPTSRDVALVRLRAPVSADLVAPIDLADHAGVGQEVATYSYGRDRSFILSSEPSCHILGREGTLLGTSCEATPGVSGAPLILSTPDGPRVVGVIAAMTGAKPPLMRGRALSVSVDRTARDGLFGPTALVDQAADVQPARPVLSPLHRP